MGAGAVRAQQESVSVSSSTARCCHQRSNQSNSSSNHGGTPTRLSTGINSNMKCESCRQNFTLFRRKKLCGACGRHFCSRCLPEDKRRPKSSERQCEKCAILVSGSFTRAEIALWRIKDLRCFLDHNNVATRMCREKQDLVDLLVIHFKKSETETGMEQPSGHWRDSGTGSTSSCVQPPAAPVAPSQIPAPPASQLYGEEEGGEGDGGSREGRRESLSERGSAPSGERQEVTSDEDRHAEALAESLVAQLAELEIGADQSGGDPVTDTPPESLSTTTADPVLSQDESSAPASQTSGLSQTQQAGRVEREEAEVHYPSSFQPDPPQVLEPRRSNRLHLDDISSEEDIETLSVKQLKEILVNNFVDFKGCCEKRELTDRVKRLWNSKQDSRERDVHELDVDSPDLCKVCMDAVINCVLLECGHMVSCTQCGKQLTECPICRQCIIRVVHIFRS